jgi:hypothetical protein
MVLIYNLWALLTGIVIFIAGVTVHSLAPTAFTDANVLWTVGALVTVIGGGAEIAGIRGRLFFMPIWFIGTIVLSFAAYGRFGIVAVIIPVVSAVIAVWWMIQATKKREEQQWARAKETIPVLKAFAGDSCSTEFWKLVKNSLYLPLNDDLTPEILKHNLEVARLVLERASLPDQHLVAWDSLETFLKRNLARPKPAAMDYVLSQHLGNLIDAQTKSPARRVIPAHMAATAA